MNKVLLVLALAAVAGTCHREAQARDAVCVWTAPGDDGNVGRAASYELRFKTVPPAAGDTLTWWNNAAGVVVPVPSVAGAADSARVTGLVAGSSYFFLVRAIDEAGNIGDWSNVAVLQALDVARPGRIGLAVFPR